MSYRLGPRFRKQEKITSSIWGIPYLREGPPVQNRLWDVLVRSIFYPAILYAGIEKDFLRIRIRENNKIVLDFNGMKLLMMIKLRSIVFGLTQPPFILERTLDAHFDNYEQEF